MVAWLCICMMPIMALFILVMGTLFVCAWFVLTPVMPSLFYTGKIARYLFFVSLLFNRWMRVFIEFIEPRRGSAIYEKKLLNHRFYGQTRVRSSRTKILPWYSEVIDRFETARPVWYCQTLTALRHIKKVMICISSLRPQTHDADFDLKNLFKEKTDT